MKYVCVLASIKRNEGGGDYGTLDIKDLVWKIMLHNMQNAQQNWF